VLDAMFTLIKRHGRIVVCGAIDGEAILKMILYPLTRLGYNGKALQLHNWREIVFNRIKVEGKCSSFSLTFVGDERLSRFPLL